MCIRSQNIHSKVTSWRHVVTYVAYPRCPHWRGCRGRPPCSARPPRRWCRWWRAGGSGRSPRGPRLEGRGSARTGTRSPSPGRTTAAHAAGSASWGEHNLLYNYYVWGNMHLYYVYFMASATDSHPGLISHWCYPGKIWPSTSQRPKFNPSLKCSYVQC